MKSPVFDLDEPFRHDGTVVGRYPHYEPNLSGWILGAEKLAGKAALLEVPSRRGPRRPDRLPPAVPRPGTRDLPAAVQRGAAGRVGCVTVKVFAVAISRCSTASPCETARNDVPTKLLEVAIERERSVDGEPLHDREATCVGECERLVVVDAEDLHRQQMVPLGYVDNLLAGEKVDKCVVCHRAIDSRDE